MYIIRSRKLILVQCVYIILCHFVESWNQQCNEDTQLFHCCKELPPSYPFTVTPLPPSVPNPWQLLISSSLLQFVKSGKCYLNESYSMYNTLLAGKGRGALLLLNHWLPLTLLLQKNGERRGVGLIIPGL